MEKKAIRLGHWTRALIMLGALTAASTASADSSACEELADKLYGPPPGLDQHWELETRAVLASWRDDFTYTAFSMAPGYTPDEPLNSEFSSSVSAFHLVQQNADAVFEGHFDAIFPVSNVSREDFNNLTLLRSGELLIEALSWGTESTPLLNLDCHRGDGGQVIVTSIGAISDVGQDFWTFALRPVPMADLI